MAREEWRPVAEPDFCDLYMVSNYGRVAKIIRGGFSKQSGYSVVSLTRKGRASRYYRLHQLVARAFVPGFAADLVVNHIDGDPQNNAPDNLEYVTQGENVRHSIRLGLRSMERERKTGQFAPILTEDQVGEIKALISCHTPLYLIAKDYGVTTPAIQAIKSGKNWNRVPAKP